MMIPLPLVLIAWLFKKETKLVLLTNGDMLLQIQILTDTVHVVE